LRVNGIGGGDLCIGEVRMRRTHRPGKNEK
jgi:hypothetical protein